MMEMMIKKTQSNIVYQVIQQFKASASFLRAGQFIFLYIIRSFSSIAS